MEFDHEKYGIKAVVRFAGNDEHEPTYSIFLRLNTLEQRTPESVALTHGLPADETQALLRALLESCVRALGVVSETERGWTTGSQKDRESDHRAAAASQPGDYPPRPSGKD